MVSFFLDGRQLEEGAEVRGRSAWRGQELHDKGYTEKLYK